MYAITNCTIFTGYDKLTEHAILIDQQRIKEVIPVNQLTDDIKAIDLNGHNISPGFIDLQLNGCGGVMFNTQQSEETLSTMHKTNLLSGTTSFLPTFITDHQQGVARAIEAVQHYMDKHSHQVLGLHLEGPFINKVKKGIHRENYIQQATPQLIKGFCAQSNVIKKITLAPECVPLPLIKQLSEAGIIVSLGHSNASYQQATQAIKQGASFTTHLFNAMSQMTGRAPGLVGATYDNDIYAGIIVDGFHVAYENVRLSKKIMGKKLVLVSDATAAAGADIKEFNFVGNKVYFNDGKCVDEQGTLGGSAVTLIQSIQQCVEQVGISLAEAIRMASLYPARAIALDHELGSIEKGKVANLSIFDNSFKVLGTVVNGDYQALA